MSKTDKQKVAFVMGRIGNGFAATTRPYDSKHQIGLPVGYVESNEIPIAGAYREAKEEGWVFGYLPYL